MEEKQELGKSEVLHMRIPAALAVRLHREAKAQKRSLTQTVNILLADALSRQEEAAETEEPRELTVVPLEEA